jgi:acyl carrier protein
MIPSAYVFLEAFPLTVNGKLDREALPSPGSERPRLASEYVAPQTDVEKIVADLWQAALRQDTVGVNDNFFDLGADSLMITVVHRQLLSQLKREIPITDLFQFPTIRSLAEHLGQKQAESDLGDKTQARAQLQRAAMARNRRPGGVQSVVP